MEFGKHIFVTALSGRPCMLHAPHQFIFERIAYCRTRRCGQSYGVTTDRSCASATATIYGKGDGGDGIICKYEYGRK